MKLGRKASQGIKRKREQALLRDHVAPKLNDIDAAMPTNKRKSTKNVTSAPRPAGRILRSDTFIINS
jgi:hypothetical protein